MAVLVQGEVVVVVVGLEACSLLLTLEHQSIIQHRCYLVMRVHYKSTSRSKCEEL